MDFEEGFWDWRMVLVFTNGLMTENIKMNSKIIRCMTLDTLNGPMAESIRESGYFKRSMDFPLRPCRILNRDFCMAQMNYSLICLCLSLLCLVGLMIPYYIKGFISWSNYMTESCTKMFLTTLRTTMILKPLTQPQTPYWLQCQIFNKDLKCVGLFI